MLLLTRIFSSTALHNGSIFLDSVLQLLKLQLAHKNAEANHQHDACVALEREFMREVESFRPCFTLSASLEVADEYSTRLYRALHYFGLHDDPLARQLDLIVGRKSMRAANEHVMNVAFKERTSVPLQKRTLGKHMMRGNRQSELTETHHQQQKQQQKQSICGLEEEKYRDNMSKSLSAESSNALLHDNSAQVSFFDIMFNSNADQVLPTELPNPPKVDVKATRRKHAIRMPDQYRGHWVLQDPDIAITREERREDPW